MSLHRKAWQLNEVQGRIWRVFLENWHQAKLWQQQDGEKKLR